MKEFGATNKFYNEMWLFFSWPHWRVAAKKAKWICVMIFCRTYVIELYFVESELRTPQLVITTEFTNF